ncbi:MAG: hypothetical protein ABJN26_00775 [Stappiaceae bacterium]
MNISYLRTWIIAFFASFAWSASALATPSAGIVVSDEIVGTTPNSFFVLRNTLFHPPSYYAFRERLEFVELSNRDGSVLHKCIVRQTENTSDAGADQEVWQRTEEAQTDCRVFQTLSERDASYIVPRGSGSAEFTFHLSAEGVTVKDAWAEPDEKAVALLPNAKLMAVASSVTAIPVADIPWQTGEDESSTYHLIGTGAESMSEICEIDGTAVGSKRSKWLYVRFFCWSGDQDVDGANFYLPVDSSKWRNDP